MSFNRKQQDNRKINNLVAKHDHNRGGFHEKTYKQKRVNMKADLNQIDLNDVELMEQLEEEYCHD